VYVVNLNLKLSLIIFIFFYEILFIYILFNRQTGIEKFMFTEIYDATS